MSVRPLRAGAPASVRDVLEQLRPEPRDGRPYVYVCMIGTVDGRATLGGRSAALGDEADLEMLLELRTLADAVLIGVGTLRAEGYARLVRDGRRRARRRSAGRTEDPPAVILSRAFDLPWDAGLFAAPEQPVIVYTGADAGTEHDDRAPAAPFEPPPVAAPVEVVRLPRPDPAAVLGDLRSRGVRTLLCEGGPTVNRSLLAAGLVDELFMTVAPLLTAGVPDTIVAGPALDEPARLELRHVLLHGDELLLRYGVRGAGA